MLHAPEDRDILRTERAQMGGQDLGIARCRGIDDHGPLGNGRERVLRFEGWGGRPSPIRLLQVGLMLCV
jgi:hypothetical protein